MEQLEKGKTVIAHKVLNDKESGTVTEVEVIYGGEETGYLRTQDGDIKRLGREQYQEILLEYREEQQKSEAADQIIHEGEAESDFFDQEDQKPETAAEEPERQELVKTPQGVLKTLGKNTDARLHQKKIFIPVIILGVVVLVTLSLLLAQNMTRNDQQMQEPDEADNSFLYFYDSNNHAY